MAPLVVLRPDERVDLREALGREIGLAPGSLCRRDFLRRFRQAERLNRRDARARRRHADRDRDRRRHF